MNDEILKTKNAEKLMQLLVKCGVNVVDDEDWKDCLDKTSRGQIKPTYNNHKLVFENAIKGELKYNEFERVIEYNNECLNNTNLAILRNAFERECGFRNQNATRDFIIEYSYNNRYNPVKNYLESLVWDGKERVQTLFIDWFKVDDTIVNRKLAEKWIVSGVKRIFEPGCLIEGMIVLIGAQGQGKSTFIKRLAKKYCVEAIVDLRNEKQCVELFNHAWIVNFDELKSIIKADSDLAKAVLTRQSDTSRLAYREESESYDRHCIFIGATNDTSILKDYTGEIERRYWIMKCNQTDKKYIYEKFTDEIVNQIWAEAYHIYSLNPNYNISISDFTDDENETFKSTQRNFKTYAEDDLVEEVREILNRDYNLVNGVFKSKDDFVIQVLKEQYNDYEKSLFDKIDAIPFSYLNHLLRQQFKSTRPNKWLATALQDEWDDVERYDYDGQRLHCLVRKKSISYDAR